jgi:hypothetical protein
LGGEVPVRPRKDEERRKGKREKAKGKREKGEKEKGKREKSEKECPGGIEPPFPQMALRPF